MKTVDCIHCGNQFKRYVSKSRTNTRFCSRSCQSDWTWVHRTRPAIVDGKMSINNLGPFRRFIEERDGLQCAICGQGATWNGTPLQLHIDHIDGDRTNNRGSNLRFLDPNCHSQQPTSYNRKIGVNFKKN